MNKWDKRVASGLLGRACLICFASLLISLIGTASAAAQSYPEPHRIWWRPTYGWVETSELDPGFSSAHEHRVEMAFKWLHSRNLQQVDTPRTPNQHGTYEHELRFLPGSSTEVPWCDGQAYNQFKDLPAESYFDTSGRDPGEFAWGVQAWRLVQDYVYTIRFDCDSDPATENNRFRLVGQIGHCDNPPCGTLEVLADETNTLVPRKKGKVLDGRKNFRQSFTHGTTAGASFENGTSPWKIFRGKFDRRCDSSVAYHKKCLVRVVPDGDGMVSMLYSKSPSPSSLGTAQLYNNAMVRCPSYWNGDACDIQLHLRGEDSSGASEEFVGFYDIPKDDRWYAIFLGGQSFRDGIVKWKLKVKGSASDIFQIDYNQQYYLRPF